MLRAPTPGINLFFSYSCFIVSCTIGQDIILKQAKASDRTIVTLLGVQGNMNFKTQSDGLHIQFPMTSSYSSLRKMNAWTLKLTSLL